MPRRRTPVDPAAVECSAPDCANRFVPKRSTARYCSATCRQRASRSRKAAAAETEAKKSEGEGNSAEHSLVTAVRKELEKAKAFDTVAGQLALQFARRIVDPEQAAISSMSKELRSLLTEAKAAVAGGGPAPAPEPEPDDEVTKARKAKEAKAAAAAGGS